MTLTRFLTGLAFVLAPCCWWVVMKWLQIPAAQCPNEANNCAYLILLMAILLSAWLIGRYLP